MTVGHGPEDRALLGARLRSAGVTALVDVRRFPGSRSNSDVRREALAEWLPGEGLAYRWEERLGGRRRLPPDSPDVSLRNESFRGYAAWMRGPDFRAALAEVLAEPRRSAVMCSESLWWRCHRRLVADQLVVAGWGVEHVGSDGRASPHALTEFAQVSGGSVSYPALGGEQLSL